MKAPLQNPAVSDPRAALAARPDDATATFAEVAVDWMLCSGRHLERLVERREFPTPMRFGRNRIYRVGTIRAFLRDQAEKANG